MTKIGVIGGSGLYNIDGLENSQEIKVVTPFGEPSDNYIKGELEGKEVFFLPRHRKGHTILPSELNFRANIYGFKNLGVERIISLSAVGSLKEELKPRDIVIPDQFIDHTKGRRDTFFGEGVAAHIPFADPLCEDLAGFTYQAALSCDTQVHKGGTYLNMEGPAFSTKAESNLYRSWGLDIIGMTNMTEAKLAREAEICYVTIALVTDYDCWKEEEEVSVETIIANLNHNADNAKKIVKEIIKALPQERKCSCKNALEYAIITNPEKISPASKEKLALLIGRYIK
jgi:5'-methylthioadenosine phosphorylase